MFKVEFSRPVLPFVFFQQMPCQAAQVLCLGVGKGIVREREREKERESKRERKREREREREIWKTKRDKDTEFR